MCYIDGQKNKYSVLKECNRMLKYNTITIYSSRALNYVVILFLVSQLRSFAILVTDVGVASNVFMFIRSFVKKVSFRDESVLKETDKRV
jgi:hypothetical protein